MNVHPLLVHFPIALLTIYALLEVASLTRLGKLSYWFYLKATFLILGALSTIPAILAGEVIKSSYSSSPDFAHLVSVHSRFGIATAVVFSVLAAAYFVVWI